MRSSSAPASLRVADDVGHQDRRDFARVSPTALRRRDQVSRPFRVVRAKPLGRHRKDARGMSIIGLSMAVLPCRAEEDVEAGSAALRVDWPVYPRRAEHNTVAEGGNRRWAEIARQNAFPSRWPRADRGVGPALTAAARPPRAFGNAENGWRVRWPRRAAREFGGLTGFSRL